MKVRRCDIPTARQGVARLHRHLPRAPRSALVAFELVDSSGWPHAWAMVGRPGAPALDQAGWAEVTRVASDGTPNACSALYGAAARWASVERARDPPDLPDVVGRPLRALATLARPAPAARSGGGPPDVHPPGGPQRRAGLGDKRVGDHRLPLAPGLIEALARPFRLLP